MAEVEVGLQVAFYLYPCGLFAALFLSQLVRYRYRHVDDGAPANEKTEKAKRFYTGLLRILQGVLTPLLLASIILVAWEATSGSYGVPERVKFPYSSYLVAHIGVLLYFLAGLLPNPDGPWSPSVAHCHAWVIGILVEIVVAALFLTEHALIGIHAAVLDSLLSLSLARIVVLVLMVGLLIRREYESKPKEHGTSGERQSLLENGDAAAVPNGYSATNGSPAKPEPKGPAKPRTAGWFDYFAGFRVLFPYLWPKGSVQYQIIVVMCVILLIGQRIINILVPYQLGVLVDALGYGRVPYREAGLYILYRGLQGGQGALGAARSVLWIPVSQSLFSRLSCAAFEHVLGLSMDFHLSKRIGEVTSALNRGSSINSFLENFLFQVFPMIFDIFVAAIFFFFKYDAFYALIVLLIMWCYLFLTVYMAKYRGRQRRDMTNKSREMDAAKTDAIMAYETVQHNCAVPAETEHFKSHVTIYQKAERLVLLSLNGLNLTQSSVFTLGTAFIVGVSAYKISIDKQSVAGFVSLITYFAQLQAPLNFFGTFYTMLQNNLIDAERMLDLFKENSGIVEKPDAVGLDEPRGEVRFNNVNFSYQNGNAAIDGVNFTVPPGTKTAIVGESGSGKSTCLKLLFRFYDVNGGSITVDGHDVRDLTLDGLRKNIGVVPQDTVLFNNSVMYNIMYAKPNATEADVYRACQAANIHERIMAFPEQYDTKVGERGLKLSGGERQRIAIARAILKDSRILLLDEATASLDSGTERQIQGALQSVTAGRTTITIAHRLSTIVNSDQIIVLHKGKIVERGTHAELIAMNGSYHAMWEKQTTAEEEEKKEKTQTPTSEEAATSN